MYEIWSLGHKPFEDDDGREVNIACIASQSCSYLHGRKSLRWTIFVDFMDVSYYHSIPILISDAHNIP